MSTAAYSPGLELIDTALPRPLDLSTIAATVRMPSEAVKTSSGALPACWFAEPENYRDARELADQIEALGLQSRIYGVRDGFWVPIGSRECTGAFWKTLFVPYSLKDRFRAALGRIGPRSGIQPLLFSTFGVTATDFKHGASSQSTELDKSDRQTISRHKVPPLAIEAALAQHDEKHGNGSPFVTWRLALPHTGDVYIGFVLEGEEIKAVQKVALGKAANHLAREIRALQYLAKRYPQLLPSIPRVIAKSATPGRLACLQTAMPGRSIHSEVRDGSTRLSAHRRRLQAAAEWIAKFQVLTRTPGEEWKQKLFRLQQAVQNHPAISQAGCDSLLGAIDAAPLDISQVAGHLDYWGGNMLLHHDGVGVVDWPDFKLHFHPFHDPGFFLINYARDYVSRKYHCSQGPNWLQLAFRTDRDFAFLTRFYLEHYCRLAQQGSPEAVLNYLPVMLARYACYSPHRQDWTAVCESWASDPQMFRDLPHRWRDRRRISVPAVFHRVFTPSQHVET